MLCHRFAGPLDAGEGVTGGGTDGASGGAPGDDALQFINRRVRRTEEAHGETAFFAVADLPSGGRKICVGLVEYCFVGKLRGFAIRNEPGVFDQGGVLVEGKDVEETDAVGPGGLEIHESDGGGV